MTIRVQAVRSLLISAAALAVAIDLDPKDFNTTFTLAIAYLQQRQFPSARRVFDRMIAQFGEHPEMRVRIGRAFREAGRLPEAIDEFKKAIALNSKLPGAHYNLGYAYLLNEGAAAVANAEEDDCACDCETRVHAAGNEVAV